MNKENNYIKIFNVSFGNYAFGSILICIVSGIFLALPYDVSKPMESISKMLLLDEGARLIRSIHYWSAQFFLVFTLLHFIDHLRLYTEKNVSKGIWFRLTLSILLVVFVMLSGFILKGDSESFLAQSIFKNLIDKIPLIGNTISFFLLGSQDNFQIVYVHHIATAVIFLLIFIIEHAKSIAPSKRTFSILIPVIIIISFLLTPNLHDKFSSFVKGPWYLVGVQELLHWLTYPSIFLFIVFIVITLIFILRYLQKKHSVFVKKILLIFLFLYLILSVIGFYFRGENWELKYPWQYNPYENIFSGSIREFKKFFSESDTTKINLVMGRYEGCLSCHNNVVGLSHSHSSIGCSSCHLGNPFTLDKNSAHSNMILIPGNLLMAKKTCGSSQCHQQIIERVNNSLMNTMSGVISVNKFVFDESNSLNNIYRVENLGSSPADIHLRNLCASCHLSNEKNELGPINQLSRGGGCNACHLSYSNDAREYLKNYKITRLQNYKIEGTQDYKSAGLQDFRIAGLKDDENNQNLLKKDFNKIEFHPDIKLPNSNDYCFGCHSRSGRISTNYEGWHETELISIDTIQNKNYRQLDDGRIFVKKISDVHHDKGMICIDCHTSSEIMGDGNLYAHKEEQVKIQCVDCHLIDKPKTKILAEFDYESKKITELRNYNQDDRKYLTVQKTGEPIINSFFDGSNAYLIKKKNNEIEKMKKPLSQCIAVKAHKDLSCIACHTSWSPQCIGCHTEYNKNETRFDLLYNKEMKGEWKEYSKDFLSDYPALGVKIENRKRTISTFIPGMILTIDKDKYDRKDKIIFKRLFAPAFSHTIRKESRSCKSCHNEPTALGYGRGKLYYQIAGNKGIWKFIPEYKNSKYDGLPLDAWVGFMHERKNNSSTRNNVRPFTIEEQKKILTVGACLVCHNPDSEIMKASLIDFEKVLRNLSKKCALPVWN